MTQFNPSWTIDKATYDALMENRDRPLTDPPIQRRQAVPLPTPGGRESLMDWVVAQVEKGLL